MGGKYYPELSLDFSQLIDYVNTFSDDFQKLRFLSQYVRLFAIYAEHEPYKLDELISKFPKKFREQVWELYKKEFQRGLKTLDVKGEGDESLNEIEALIEKIDVAMHKRMGNKPTQNIVWHELRNRPEKYPVEEIIGEVGPKQFEWFSRDGKKHLMQYSTFKKTLSNLRSKRKGLP